MQTRQQRIGVNFSANSIAHMLRIIKKDVSKKEYVFHASDNHSNKGVNVDVISNVVTFLTLPLKFRQCIVSKRHIFMNNGDSFIKFSG